MSILLAVFSSTLLGGQLLHFISDAPWDGIGLYLIRGNVTQNNGSHTVATITREASTIKVPPIYTWYK